MRLSNVLIFGLIGFSVLTAGCATKQNVFRNRANDYKKIERAPNRIRVPAEVSPDSFSEEYRIPGEQGYN